MLITTNKTMENDLNDLNDLKDLKDFKNSNLIFLFCILHHLGLLYYTYIILQFYKLFTHLIVYLLVQQIL